MKRYNHTITRILSGFAMLAMFAWFLWPRGTGLMDREEALFTFILALAVWIVTEIKESDEIIYRAATKNDIRLARELISYHADKFRVLLKDHDHYHPLNTQYFSEASLLLNEQETGLAFFQDRRLAPRFMDFCHALNVFSSYMAEHSSPNEFGLQSIRYPGTQDPRRVEGEIKEANRLASLAWQEMVILINEIKDRAPEAFDEPIEYRWFRSSEIYSKVKPK